LDIDYSNFTDFSDKPLMSITERGKGTMKKPVIMDCDPGLRIQIKRIGATHLYDGAILFTQDKYEETGNNKFRIVCNSLEDAAKGAGDKAGNINQYLSFTSYYNVIPNPCPDGQRMNEKVGKWVVDKQRANNNLPINFGIVASDGVDRRYIYNILCTNFLRTDY
jgi:hypothetical protein